MAQRLPLWFERQLTMKSTLSEPLGQPTSCPIAFWRFKFPLTQNRTPLQDFRLARNLVLLLLKDPRLWMNLTRTTRTWRKLALFDGASSYGDESPFTRSPNLKDLVHLSQELCRHMIIRNEDSIRTPSGLWEDSHELQTPCSESHG